MSETASCLAVSETRQSHRPGGCVGIFFQLLDWNRKFLSKKKKKLFSKKLLTPAREKQLSKRYGFDEKMPKTKLQLIADNNSERFSRSNKSGDSNGDIMEPSGEMQAPSLVARLMGLDSMPVATNRGMNKQDLKNALRDASGMKYVVDSSNKGCKIENLNKLEKRIARIESRPKKLLKTRQFEKRVATRFVTEALQIKSVLSNPRKQHPPKLVLPPIKSPRNSSSQNLSRKSRLIDAATRILEPGVQASNRARNSISYSSSLSYTNNEVLMEGVRVISPEPARQHQSNPSFSVIVGSKSSPGQSCCKHCGNLLDGVNSEPKMQQPFVSLTSASLSESSYSNDLERIKQRLLLSSLELEQGASHSSEQVPDDEEDKQQASDDSKTEVKLLVSKPSFNKASSRAVKSRPQTQNETSASRSTTSPNAKTGNMQSKRASAAANVINGTKDFIALNRILSGQTRPRASLKAENIVMATAERKYCDRQVHSLSQSTSPKHKRTVNISAQFEGNSLSSHKNWRLKATECAPIKRGWSKEECDRTNSNKAKNVRSFPVKSPPKLNSLSNFNTSGEEKQVFHENGGRRFEKNRSLLAEDALDVLLRQKLKGLTSLKDVDSSGSKDTILRKIISALTAEEPIPPVGSMFKASFMIGHDTEHLSPGSVLDTSFSNSSCFSSSINDGSGRLPDFINYYGDQPEDMIVNDPGDSVISTKEVTKKVINLVYHVLRVLQSCSLASGGFTSATIDYATNVILNAELLFHKTSICDFLLDDLETLASTLCANFNSLCSSELIKGNNLLKRFAFDCVMECLDLNYTRYCNCGFKEWRRLPLCMNKGRLIQEVIEEMQKWADMVWLDSNEMIEWEMNHSLEKWTDHDIQAFEMGIDIGSDILQVLVEEIVLDLWEFRLACF